MPASKNFLRRVRPKRASKADLKTPIYKYIDRVYGDHVAQEADESLEELQDLRNQILAAGSSNFAIGTDHYAKYYNALRAVEIRFPVSSDSTHVNIGFKWYDAFSDRESCTQKNIHFEKAAVLFSLGALYSSQACDVARDTQAGIAEAAKAFAAAAGVFKHLREEVVLKTETPRSVDISGECASMLEAIMVAQAQEMFYEMLSAKRAADGESSVIKWSTLAAVAWSVHELYNEAAANYSKPALEKHVQREWGESSKVKAVMYQAEAHYMQSKQCAADPKAQGLRKGHLEHAVAILKNASADMRLAPKELQAQAKALEKEINTEERTAHQENVGIYLQAVPAPDALPRIEGKQMASAKFPEADLAAQQQEWFRDIVPDKVTRNLSRYTSQMEDLVRSYMTKLETATDDTRVALASHGLPTVLDAMNPGFRPELPEVAKVALADDFVQRGLAGQLPSMCDTLRALREQAVLDLRNCGEMLDHEQALDDSMRSQYGDAWARPLSRIAAAAYRENIARYESNLQAAADSDRANDARIAEALPRLQKLSVESVRSMLPPLQQPMVAPGADGDVVVGNLRQILAQLSALGRERAALEEDIKTKQREDNVLPDLLKAGPEGPDRVFEAHLAAFRQGAAGVDGNVAKTNEALALLQQYIDAFRKLYDVDGWQAECNRIAGQVRDDVRTGNDLVSQVGEGIQFYSGMQEHVNKLKQMCNDYVMARNYDQERRVSDIHKQKDNAASEEVARRMAQLDVAPQHTHTQPPPPPPAQHMYPQHMAPMHTAQAPAPYSMYPPPPPPAAPYGAGQPAPPPPGGAAPQFYQPSMYPQQPPPPPR